MFNRLVKSARLWQELCLSKTSEAEDLFLNSMDNLSKFRGLELFRGNLLEASDSQKEKDIQEAINLLEKSLNQLERNKYDGDMEIQMAHSILSAEIAGAIQEIAQFSRNINNNRAK